MSSVRCRVTCSSTRMTLTWSRFLVVHRTTPLTGSTSLSSRIQPFYSLRINPTSASALVSLSRHDPNRPYKASSGSASSSATSILGLGGNSNRDSSGKTADGKNWQEVLTTTLEPETRRHRPEDGLVAVLYPAAAAKIASDRPTDEQAMVTAELECALPCKVAALTRPMRFSSAWLLS